MARRLSLLGGFELRCSGQDVAVSRNGQRLVALLALQGRPLERLWVAGTLWLDAPEERAGASLRSALWRLPQPGGTAVVEASATHQPEPAALARDLLPDWYDDWVVLERERFRQLRLHAGGAVCAADRGRTVRGRRAGRAGRGVGRAAARERPPHPHPGPLAEGNPGEAVRQYHLYRRPLADELALEPSAAIRGLVQPPRR
jgi:hypothetical protein